MGFSVSLVYLSWLEAYYRARTILLISVRKTSMFSVVNGWEPEFQYMASFFNSDNCRLVIGESDVGTLNIIFCFACSSVRNVCLQVASVEYIFNSSRVTPKAKGCLLAPVASYRRCKLLIVICKLFNILVTNWPTKEFSPSSIHSQSIAKGLAYPLPFLLYAVFSVLLLSPVALASFFGVVLSPLLQTAEEYYSG